MKRIRVSALAEHDLEDAACYVATNAGSFDTADRIIASITGKFRLLARQPAAGMLRPDIGPGLRSFPVGKYVIYYVEASDHIRIARVLHGMRDQKSAFRGT